MKKELEFPGCILVHTISGTTHLLDGPRDLMDLMDGDCLDDACMDEGMKTLPTDPGVYSATIEYWFSQGYFEGYPAPGESDYDFRLSNLQRIDLSRTLAPAEVEDLLDHIISAANSVSIPSESNYLNELKSRLLAALTNTIPYLSGDVSVPGTEMIPKEWPDDSISIPDNPDEWTDADYENAMALVRPIFDKIGDYEAKHFPMDEPSREAREEFRRDQMGEDHRETLKRHPWNRTCPVCGQDCSTVALVKLVYRFEECNCSYQRKKELMEELKDKEYRDEYVSSSVDVGIAFQIRALREQREWNQARLAKEAGMQQARISVLENPSHSPTLDTLKKLAAAFDIGLIVKFVPFSEMVKRELNLPNESLEAASFDKDPYFKPPSNID